MRIIFLLFVIIICSKSVHGQTQKKIDSLHSIIANTNDIDTKLEAYAEIINIESSTNLDHMLLSIEKVKDLHKKESCDKCLGIAMYWEGRYHYYNGNFAKAIPFFESAVKTSFEAGDNYTSNKALTLLSAIYFSVNDYPNAEKYANQLITKGEAQSELSDALIDGYFMKGLINDDQSYYSLAITNYNKADSLNSVKKGPNFHAYQAKLYNNLSIVFIQVEDFEKAEEYLKKTELNYKKDENKEGLYSVKQNFGYLKVEQGDYQKAIDILSETNTYYKELKMKHREGESNYLLGRAYYGLNQYRKAIQHLDRSLVAFKNAGDTLNSGLSHKYIGDNYLKINNVDSSAYHFKQALDIFNSLNAHRNQLNTLKSYASLFEKTKDYQKALQLFKEVDSINAIFQIKQNEKSVFELDTKYQTEKKEQEIALLQAQNQAVEAQKKNQRNLLLGGIGLTSIAGIFLFLGFRNRKKTNDKLRELDSMKSSFFENISHEFRTPLALIAGPVEQQLQKTDIEPSEKKNLTIAQRNTKRLLTLVDQLLDLSKLETGHFKLKVQQGDLGVFLKSLASSFNYLAQENNQTYTVNIDVPENTYYFDADAVEKIVTNLISNAIKFSPNGEAIEITGTIQDQKLQLSIKNSGAPLSQEALQTIFNRFERIDEQTAGTGIGLALSKELVVLHKGTIQAHSKDPWTTFTMTVPVTEAAFSETEKAKGVISETAFANLPRRQAGAETTSIQDEITIEEIDIFSKDTQPILLIIDDNADLRTYVSSLFEDTYTIYMAQDGAEGFDIASSVVPDLIITDLMMPKDDGITLTRNCKTTEATSHIPIVMLTAKAGDENQLLGLENGADAYISKPFNTEILKTTVHNLLDTRKKLQERFSQEVILIPKDMAVNSVDERFLDNLKEVVDTQIIESDFTTESFAKALGMSRMQLHRKLKALTGLSSTEFIRSQRLKLAAQLLKKSEINVSQVGYAVGFNNHSYFTKCFKEQYGVSPSDYAKKS
ncbi:response regulator [Dokdonia ponticola]|uniref:histidine kinase n=1 Tax=Dokdonia ponticola TaxID=2041041 RepID=A0ABV9HWE6_9FLAO